MKKIDLYETAIKITGLYLIVLLIGQLRDVLLYASLLVQSKNNPDSLSGFNQTPVFWVVLLCFIVLAAFTALLLFKTQTISKFICSKEDVEKSIELSLDKKNIYEIALLVVGLVTIVLTFPDFIMHLKSSIQASRSFSGSPMEINLLLTDGLKITIGVLAVLYAKNLSLYFGKDNQSSKNN